MQGPGRADIVNAGSGESGYSECRVLGLVTLYSWFVDLEWELQTD
ncbi:unnamed protein product [Staurois parvus]|uniref:Uncharacterized protein n=1 Tax=Staurois parvus TaxID=386267 RepID=A0ABN9BT44_9NEOB|nr:unnamed protein product [Staurois parvus]